MSNLKSLNCPNCGATVPIPSGTKRTTLSVDPDTGVTAQAVDATPRTVTCPSCRSTLEVSADQSGPQISVGGGIAGGDMTVFQTGDPTTANTVQAKVAKKLAEAAARTASAQAGGQSVVSGATIVNRRITHVGGQPFDPTNPAHKAAYETRKTRGVVD